VARVLAFSTVYDWRLKGDAMRVSDRLLGSTGGPRKQFTCPQTEPAKPAVSQPAKQPVSKKPRRQH
ncbi:MAG: hypothetical protein ABIP61_13095, partial [Burkholderiaceae bacterium]